jgi:hypothetical protein
MAAELVFKNSFSKLRGKFCWGVRPGHGSFLSLEFGKPHLDFREPLPLAKSPSAKVTEVLSRRRVVVRGEWHWWLYQCDWEVRSAGRVVGGSSRKAAVGRAADFLDGQRLVRFSVGPRRAQCRFEFDLGAVLTTRPYDAKSEQWMLFEPSGRVLVLRGDGSCTRSHVELRKD